MKRISLFCFALVLSFGSVAFTQAKRNLTVDDYFQIHDATDPQLSQDGKWITYVLDNYDAKNDEWNSDVYMISTSGGRAIQLTNSEKDDTFPRWSPDNKYLAFLSKRNEDTKQVFLLSRNGGEPVQLTDVKQGVSAFSWAPDSKKLALVIQDRDPDSPEEKSDEPKTTPKPIVITRLQFLFDEYGFLKELYHHVYVFDLETKDLKQITFGPYDDTTPLWSGYGESSPQWSPDGKQILFVSNRTGNPDGNRNTDLFLVPAGGGEPRKLTTNEGTEETPRWSPDGKYIVYQTTLHPELMWYDTIEIAVIPVSGGTPKVLTDLDRNCFKPQFSADGKRVYFLLEDRGMQRLAGITLADNNYNLNIVGENVVSNFDVGSADTIAFAASRRDMPYEVFYFTNGKSQQVTSTNAKALEPIQLGTAERLQFKSKDGTPVEGFITKPPQFDPGKKYPLILWIHGGPTEQYSEEFEFQSQLLAANGYVVLRVNPRGSTGYGRDFCKAIWADWGHVDYEDVMAGVNAVIAQGYVDPERLGVGGWSYGGMLTDHVITKTNRFKAAISGASELNYLMDYGTDHYQYEWETELGLPWDVPEKYTRISPFFQIKNVVTPTLVLCGEQDWNVPLVNSEQLYQALRRLGIDTMLIVYPGEPHSIYTPSYEKDRFERYLAWFGHFLQGAPNKVPSGFKTGGSIGAQ